MHSVKGDAVSAESLAGATVIVTGGSRGIGLATVRRLAADGAAVAFCGRDADVGAASEAQLRREGLEVSYVPGDVGREEDVKAMVAECRRRYDAPGIVVNNAGVNAFYDPEGMTDDEWDRFFATDLKSAWLVSKFVLAGMRQRGEGSIVNISSIHGLATMEGFFPYAAAKSGLIGLTRSLALDYGPYNVRVNCVAPGFVRTRLIQDNLDRQDDPAGAAAAMVANVALRRMAEPEDIADVIAFFASDQSRYVTGATLVVDGGITARRAG